MRKYTVSSPVHYLFIYLTYTFFSQGKLYSTSRLPIEQAICCMSLWLIITFISLTKPYYFSFST